MCNLERGLEPGLTLANDRTSFRENMRAHEIALSWEKIAYGVVRAEKRDLAVAGGPGNLEHTLGERVFFYTFLIHYIYYTKIFYKSQKNKAPLGALYFS